MKQLWAPWRSEYIKSEKGSDCIFCAAPEKDPADGLLLFDGALSIVILNRYPYNNGHILLAPKRHVAGIEDLDPEESLDTFRLLRHITAVLRSEMKPDGFNIGINLGLAAGAGIEDHLHIHVVPRWNGDMNFMPVLSETKVIGEHLRETHAALRARFERI